MPLGLWVSAPYVFADAGYFCGLNHENMRGQRIFNELIRDTSLSGTARRGRNASLLGLRNDCLLARYYYYGHYRNKCYEDIIRLLVSEFFLSGTTITTLIQAHTTELYQLKQRKPTIYSFQIRWPHMRWP